MFNQQSPPPMNPGNGLLALDRALWEVAQTGAVSVEIFLHKRFGEAYFRLSALAPIFLLLFVAMQYPPQESAPILMFTAAYLVLLLLHYIAIWIRCLRGNHEHSRYNGQPWWCGQIGVTHERGVKLFLEPALVLVIAATTFKVNAPLGGYLIFTALCLVFTNGMIDWWNRQQAREMHDAVIDQQQRAERFRSRAGH